MRKYAVKTRGVNSEEKYRRDRAIIYILTYTGLRVEELSNLRITNIALVLNKDSGNWEGN